MTKKLIFPRREVKEAVLKWIPDIERETTLNFLLEDIEELILANQRIDPERRIKKRDPSDRRRRVG